jgi:hypothetical protein
LRNGVAQRALTGGGADGGDVRTESGVGEGLRWWKTSEEDAWAMGTNARRSGVDGRDERRAGEKFSRPAGGGSVLTGSGGEAARRGGRRVEAERERERGRGRGPWRDSGERRGRRDADRRG